MLRLPVYLLLLFVLVSSPGWAHEPDVEPQSAERWLDSVVLLVTGPAWCSGVVIDERGTVATAYHCVASGRRPQVRLRGGDRHLGRVVASAPRADLALLAVPELAGVVPALSLLREAPPRGEPVWALGHPYAPQEEASPLLRGTLKWSVSSGVVSAVGERMIQVDAALNPGNSGGPVVDGQGRVVGIASRRLSADNVAFIAPAGRLGELVDLPERSPLGGTWGVSLSSLQGLELQHAPTLGGVADATLRDTLVARAGFYLPLWQRWTALERGQCRWPSAELIAALRVRVGRGRWSTNLDAGGGVVLLETLHAGVDPESLRLDTWREQPLLVPAGQVALGMGGASLRVLVLSDGEELVSLLGLDLGFPGVLGTF